MVFLPRVTRHSPEIPGNTKVLKSVSLSTFLYHVHFMETVIEVNHLATGKRKLGSKLGRGRTSAFDWGREVSFGSNYCEFRENRHSASNTIFDRERLQPTSH